MHLPIVLLLSLISLISPLTSASPLNRRTSATCTISPHTGKEGFYDVRMTISKSEAPNEMLLKGAISKTYTEKKLPDPSGSLTFREIKGKGKEGDHWVVANGPGKMLDTKMAGQLKQMAGRIVKGMVCDGGPEGNGEGESKAGKEQGKEPEKTYSKDGKFEDWDEMD